MKLIITSVTTTTREKTLPLWMEEALVGNKIAPIKALRETAGIGSLDHSEVLQLTHAKNIVESMMQSTYADRTKEDLTDIRITD